LWTLISPILETIMSHHILSRGYYMGACVPLVHIGTLGDLF
jgi:hypothetical protein